MFVWESIRRILNIETNIKPGTDVEIGFKRDICQEIVMLKQPDLFKDTQDDEAYVVKPRQQPLLEATYEPASVQEALDFSSMHPERAFKVWEPTKGQEKSRPASVMQIELHRQRFDSGEREWKKLTHKVKLDETVQCNGFEYTLYGMIVHRGGLDYNDYYSVLRPEGPGTPWIKYSGDGGSRPLEFLTMKQAVDAHEGGDGTESAAVAYVVMYVRSDRVSKVLKRGPRTDLIRKSLKRKSDQMTSEEETKPENIPFRVGNHYWRKAPPATRAIYSSIRETPHLSRAFYRTEFDKNATFDKAAASGMVTSEKLASEKTAADKAATVNAAAAVPAQVVSTSEPTQSEAVKVVESSSAPESEMNVDSGPATHQITVWLSVFDAEKQQLSEAKPSTTNGAANIAEHFRKELAIDEKEKWDFYHNQGLVIKEKSLVKRSYTFFDLSYGDTTWDGMVFVAQRHPTAEK